MDINLFTTTMRTNFIQGMQAVPAKEPRIGKALLEVPSTARIENYAWMTPSPGISRYLGHRRFAQIDQSRYQVANLEFDAAITVGNRDVRDDQIGGYPIKFKELGEKARAFPFRWAVQTLAAGASATCFDGSNFFATSHNQGTGNSTLPTNFGGGLNKLTYTAQGSSDGVVHKAAFLICAGTIKPLGYQIRMAPEMGTNAGTPQAQQAKQSNYWIDLEGAGFYGYWWDAIEVTVTNTPNLTDVFIVIDAAMSQFRSFKLPSALPTDPALYVHQEIEFSESDCMIVCSTKLGQLFSHALREDRLGVSVAGSTAGITANIYKGAFDLVVSGYMDP